MDDKRSEIRVRGDRYSATADALADALADTLAWRIPGPVFGLSCLSLVSPDLYIVYISYLVAKLLFGRLVVMA